MTADFVLRARADEISVRALLSELRTRLRARNLPGPACGTVEIVLAEALNNIVEHAYGDAGTGEIALHAVLSAASLTFTLSDRGVAMTAARTPAGRLPDMGTGTTTLPEGGFGWFLIRSLTREVAYRREAGVNRLTLCFDLPLPGDESR